MTLCGKLTPFKLPVMSLHRVPAEKQTDRLLLAATHIRKVALQPENGGTELEEKKVISSAQKKHPLESVQMGVK